MPPTPTPVPMHSHKALKISLAVVGALVLGYGFVLLLRNPPSSTFESMPASGMSQETPKLDASVPAPEPTESDVVSSQRGFQYVVTYSDVGFYPRVVSVRTGETVRFSNIANTVAQLATSGISSPSLKKGEYWQHTFDAVGEVVFQDTKGIQVKILVQ